MKPKTLKARLLSLIHNRLVLIGLRPVFLRLLLFQLPLIGGASLLAEERPEKGGVDVVDHFSDCSFR